MFALLARPKPLLRLEGLALFTLALALYRQLGHGWTLFWSTVLLPDLALLGYLANPGIGARLCNLTHAKLLPAALAAFGIAMGAGLPVALALIWLSTSASIACWATASNIPTPSSTPTSAPWAKTAARLDSLGLPWVAKGG